MFEKLMSVNVSKLKWALVVLGINSFFFRDTPRLLINIAIFIVALWILLLLQRNSKKQRDK